MTDYDGPDTCKRCGCCSLMWVDCESCGGDGFVDHECGEDCCCCLYPEANVPCDVCGGKGGWHECVVGCDGNGKHSTLGVTHAE